MDEKDKAQDDLKRREFPRGVYRHVKGPEYVAFAVSLDEETLEPMVQYYSIVKRTRWTRTMKRFNQRFEWVRQATLLEVHQALDLAADGYFN